jgi:hypothetical protein
MLLNVLSAMVGGGHEATGGRPLTYVPRHRQVPKPARPAGLDTELTGVGEPQVHDSCDTIGARSCSQDHSWKQWPACYGGGQGRHQVALAQRHGLVDLDTDVA